MEIKNKKKRVCRPPSEEIRGEGGKIVAIDKNKSPLGNLWHIDQMRFASLSFYIPIFIGVSIYPYGDNLMHPPTYVCTHISVHKTIIEDNILVCNQ